jgi:hypothetical protein
MKASAALFHSAARFRTESDRTTAAIALAGLRWVVA